MISNYVDLLRLEPLKTHELTLYLLGRLQELKRIVADGNAHINIVLMEERRTYS